MTLLILFFLVSITFSFLCSIWEAVLLSIPPSYVEVENQKGTVTGALLKQFKTDIDRPLSAILTLNTIAHTVGAIGVGAQAAVIWGASWQATVLVPVLMTLAILILSEIIPKTIGASNWKGLAGFTTKSLSIIIKLLYPLVLISQWITKKFKPDNKESVLSRTDFSVMAQMGAQEGIFREQESTIIQNLMQFHTVRAADIMTPRTVMMMAQQDTPIKEFYEAHHDLRFSRVPIYSTNRDSITGYILKDHLLEAIVENMGGQPLKTIIREILVVQRDFPIPELFERLIMSKEHIALVVDKYGSVVGMVTMEDVIETLLGIEIVDETDSTEDMQVLARKNWERRAKNIGLLTSDPTTTGTGGPGN